MYCIQLFQLIFKKLHNVHNFYCANKMYVMNSYDKYKELFDQKYLIFIGFVNMFMYIKINESKINAYYKYEMSDVVRGLKTSVL